jgi:branched-chain amino acid transport system substrate-binding protein
MAKDTKFINAVKGSGTSISRRKFVGATATGIAAGGLAAGPLSGRAYGQTMAGPADTLNIGFVSPRSGPLASFGEADPYVLALVRDKFKSGLPINGKTYAVNILDRDTQSDPARSSQLTKNLINSNNVDLVLATSTPEVVNPASDACEAAGVPCLSTIVPWEAWYFGRGAKPGAPSPFKWTYHFSFGVAQFATAYLSAWNNGGVATNKKLAIMDPNDADGMAIRNNLDPQLAKAGYTVVDPGPYQDGTADFSSQISQFKAAGCELFNTFPIPPDFIAFWRQAAQQGLIRQMKIVQVAKFGLFPSSVEALGSLGYNLVSTAYWHKTFPYSSPITGISSAKLAAGYEAASGKQWQQQLGASQSLFDAGFAALGQASDPKDKAAVAKALSTLKVTTTVGNVDFTKGPVPNVATTVLVNAQWVKAASGPYKLDYVVIENAEDPNVPVSYKMQPYR